MTLAEFYSYVVFPGMTLLQGAGAYWVYNAQSKRNEAMDKAVDSFRKYEGDLRNQLTDQKTMMDLVTQAVNNLKTSYTEVQANKDQLLKSSNEELERVRAKIEQQQATQLADVSKVVVDPALSELLTTVVNENASTKEQLATLTSSFQSLLAISKEGAATSKELLVRNTIAPTFFNQRGSIVRDQNEDLELAEMAYKIGYQRVKALCWPAIQMEINKQKLNKQSVRGPALGALTDMAQKAAPILAREYASVFTMYVLFIAEDLAPVQ